MIRPLRRRHRAVWSLLAIALPVGFAAGVLAREEPLRTTLLEPAISELGPRLENPSQPVLWEEPGLRLRFGSEGGGRPLVELEPLRELRRPNVLLYWTPSPVVGTELPVDAHFLGKLREARVAFALPPAATSPEGRTGALVLFQLGSPDGEPGPAGATEFEVLSTLALEGR